MQICCFENKTGFLIKMTSSLSCSEIFAYLKVRWRGTSLFNQKCLFKVTHLFKNADKYVSAANAANVPPETCIRVQKGALEL